MLYYLKFVSLFDGSALLSRITFSSCSTLCHTSFSFWLYLEVNDTRPTWLRIISKDSWILSPSSPPPPLHEVVWLSLLVPIPPLNEFFAWRVLLNFYFQSLHLKMVGGGREQQHLAVFSLNLWTQLSDGLPQKEKQTDLIFYVIETNL